MPNKKSYGRYPIETPSGKGEKCINCTIAKDAGMGDKCIQCKTPKCHSGNKCSVGCPHLVETTKGKCRHEISICTCKQFSNDGVCEHVARNIPIAPTTLDWNTTMDKICMDRHATLEEGYLENIRRIVDKYECEPGYKMAAAIKDIDQIISSLLTKERASIVEIVKNKTPDPTNTRTFIARYATAKKDILDDLIEKLK